MLIPKTKRKYRRFDATISGDTLKIDLPEITINDNHSAEFSSSNGVNIRVSKGMPVSILATVSLPQKENPVTFTYMNGNIVISDDGHIGVQLPRKTTFEKNLKYSVLFPEESVVDKPSTLNLNDFLKELLRKAKDQSKNTTD